MTHACTPACTAGWAASRKCHCSGCGENFSTPSNFDKHKPGDCLSPVKVGLVLNGSGLWSKPGEVDISARFSSQTA